MTNYERMKEMSDEEIIKTLERCAKSKTNGDCKALNCPCFKDRMCIFVDDDYGLQNLALDLINRQKAEIERLKECPKCVYEYDGEVMEYCVQSPCSNFKTVEQVKAEACKNFSQKLIKSSRLIAYANGFDIKAVVDVEEIVKILKETVGEEP